MLNCSITRPRISFSRDLVSCVQRVAAGILRFLKVGYDAFEISACWATVPATGAAHRLQSRCYDGVAGVIAGVGSFATHTARPCGISGPLRLRRS
jgi:hypothetical protein